MAQKILFIKERIVPIIKIIIKRYITYTENIINIIAKDNAKVPKNETITANNFKNMYLGLLVLSLLKKLISISNLSVIFLK